MCLWNKGNKQIYFKFYHVQIIALIRGFTVVLVKVLLNKNKEQKSFIIGLVLFH